MDILGSYIGLTETVVQITGSTHDMTHIHAGLAIYCAALLLRGLKAFPIALFLVFLAISTHELLERLYYGDWRIDDTCSDIFLTLLWPTFITLAVLLRSWRYFLSGGKKPLRLRHMPQ